MVEKMREGMAAITTQRFFSETRGVVDFPELLDDILAELRRPSGTTLRVSVGTDSEEVGSSVKFVTIVHLWRVGKGARAYRTEVVEPMPTLRHRSGSARFRERIWKEVLLTATLAQELRSALRDALDAPALDGIEVHADVGEHGGSSVMIREVLGMLKGYGFPETVIKLKPDSYAASTVADHYI